MLSIFFGLQLTAPRYRMSTIPLRSHRLHGRPQNANFRFIRSSIRISIVASRQLVRGRNRVAFLLNKTVFLPRISSIDGPFQIPVTPAIPYHHAELSTHLLFLKSFTLGTTWNESIDMLWYWPNLCIWHWQHNTGAGAGFPLPASLAGYLSTLEFVSFTHT